ncbi:MAG: chemotaxis-specific protein-glutamate methyltransferase CheB [Planctomycetes bacterium]|nr:chemotaxis-specific protein-glutamate methyltransferase CheB [Planctomycetota bacterium]
MTTRVLVVEDSLTVRQKLVETLAADREFEVVGEAEDGAAAIEQCQRLRPDVITMDMMLPVMSGLSATEYIMAYCPAPILIVSASTNRGEVFKTYDALAAGAVDVLEKPTGEEPEGAWEKNFLSTVRLVARIRVITHPRARIAERRGGPASTAASPAPLHPAGPALRAVVIGGSTGGTGAAVEILRSLPPSFPLPILFVIHIGQAFARSLSEWLDGLSPLRVRHAVDGEPLPPAGTGCVLMPPADRHLAISEGRVRIHAGPERHSCRPSVDVLFESAARDLGSAAAGVLLTGMGRDGADGLLALRRTGAPTIAQDEESCVVFGMPKEAIELGAAERVLPLRLIGPALADLAATRRAGGRP